MAKKDVVVAGAKKGDLAASITGLEGALLRRAEDMGLPSDGVLIGVRERVMVLDNLEGALSGLARERRSNSVYLSKFMMAVSAGLFDAALNYLWDETIGELRKRIVDYDLTYFFDLAVPAPEKRKDLRGEADLLKITDEELVRSAATIGFISPIGQQQLDLVRFMRNHASAAHPNQHELSPYSLLGYLETCIKEVITLPPTTAMVTTSRLLANIKQETVSDEDASSFATFFLQLREAQVDALLDGLFGIYVADATPELARDNVRKLVPHLWPRVPEDKRFSLGVRHSRFRVNLDTAQADRAREFLQVVDGMGYLAEDVRGGEIDVLLDRLIAVHNAMDNFYNEPPIARQLKEFVGSQPVPQGIRRKYVRTLVELFLGRASGISFQADGVYAALLQQLTPDEGAVALVFLTEADLAGLLSYRKPKQQLARLLDVLSTKLSTPLAKDLALLLGAFTGPRESMHLDTRISKAGDKLRKSIEKK